MAKNKVQDLQADTWGTHKTSMFLFKNNKGGSMALS